MENLKNLELEELVELFEKDDFLMSLPTEKYYLKELKKYSKIKELDADEARLMALYRRSDYDIMPRYLDMATGRTWGEMIDYMNRFNNVLTIDQAAMILGLKKSKIIKMRNRLKKLGYIRGSLPTEVLK